MNVILRLLCSALCLLLPSVPLSAAVLPVGFREEPFGQNWNVAVGLTFGKNADGTRDRAYVWERGGRVWIVENGVKLETPLVNLAEEVGAWGAMGMLGFALDPNFQSNGHVYLLYVVDRHHLLHHGTPAYDPEENEDFAATIGRITRYTARLSDDFRTVDPASRRVLVGETKSTGLPMLHTAHGTGSLVFGTDGTLLASVGDGASFEVVDNGGNAGNAYGSQGVNEGIITAAENVGSFRSQMLNSLSGKILRLDPATGDGIPSNPYYQSGSPRSARSRIWSLGLRNPYRFVVKPGTGSHDQAAGNPGTLFIGDVGWGMWEDINVADAPGQNFGWPLYEGMDVQPDYMAARPASIPIPAVHVRPRCDWTRTGTARALVNGSVSTVGTGGVQGTGFGGSCSTAGFFYTGMDFPTEYRGSYFHGDYADQWLRVFDFDAQHQVTRVREFASGEPFVFFTTHPETGGLYYCTEAGNGTVRRVIYDPGTNRPPVAVISYDVQAGASPLQVQFSSVLSSDPDGSPLTYLWNFGDGTTSTLAAPVKTFTTATPRRYDVTLTVRDAGGATGTATQIITAGNHAPRVQITNPAAGARYAITPGNQTLPLTATVTDVEHATGSLTYEWRVSLVHDHHEHAEPVSNAANTSTTIVPIACTAEATYYYRIRLSVTDPLGAVTVAERNYGPECGGAPVLTNDDFVLVTGPGQAAVIDVLDNDHGAVTSTVLPQMQTVASPAAGTVTWDAQTGRALYRHTAGAALSDSFTYRATTRDGVVSAPATVWLTILPAGTGVPAAVGDAVTLSSTDASRVIPLLANDLHAGAAAGSILLHERPLLGTVALDLVAGTATYVPFAGLTYPAADSFTYSIGNAAGRSLPVPVNVTLSAGGTPPVSTHGLRAEYFANATLSGSPVLVRTDPGIAYEWQGNAPAPGLPVDDFSVRWTGELLPRYTETHTFYVSADDGVRLWIDGALVLDRWTRGASGSYEVQVPLVANRRTPIRVEYFEGGGWATMSLVWYSASQAGEVVPESRLFAPPVALPPEVHIAAAVASVRLQSAGAGDSDFLYSRPSGLLATHRCLIEASHNLTQWREVTSAALVTPDAVSSSDVIRLPGIVSRAGEYTAHAGPRARSFYRLRILPLP